MHNTITCLPLYFIKRPMEDDWYQFSSYLNILYNRPSPGKFHVNLLINMKIIKFTFINFFAIMRIRLFISLTN